MRKEILARKKKGFKMIIKIRYSYNIFEISIKCVILREIYMTQMISRNRQVRQISKAKNEKKFKAFKKKSQKLDKFISKFS